MRRVGLRTRVTTVFALGALALSMALAGTTYELVRTSLLDERERAAVRAATLDGALVRQGLSGDEPDISLVLRNLETGDTRRPLVRRDGEWFSRTADTGFTQTVSLDLQRLVEGGTPAVQRVRLREDPVLVVGVPLLEGASYYEVTSLEELRRTLAVLATVLGLVALATTLAGAAVGWWVSRVVLRPLGDVAQAAGAIASGDLSARVSRDNDPDLDTLAVAFNAMVDEVSARSEADRRFAADVSHELRSPLQTLSAATSVLDRRRAELDGRTGAAVELIRAEVSRFEQLVTDLLELAAPTARPSGGRSTSWRSPERRRRRAGWLPSSWRSRGAVGWSSSIPGASSSCWSTCSTTPRTTAAGPCASGSTYGPTAWCSRSTTRAPACRTTSESWSSTASPAAAPRAPAAAVRAPASGWRWSRSTCRRTAARSRCETVPVAVHASVSCCPWWRR